MLMPDNHAPLTIADAQRAVDGWIRAIGVRYFSPLTNMAILAEECGEVARVIARTDGEQSPKPGEQLDLADELADLMWVTMAIANQHGIDLTGAFARNLEKKTARDASRHRCNPRLSEQSTD